MKHVTIRDVAKLAGVGIATASRAINNKGEVSPATRERVLEAAKRLGYVPNSLARGLISGKTKKIGVVITTILNPFYAAVVSSIEDVLKDWGYTLALYNSKEDPSIEKEAILLLISQRVDGLILAPIEYESENIKYLIERTIPFILVGRNTVEENTNYVVCDDFKVGRLAAEHLISKGHRRILFLNSWKSSSAKLRLEGFKTGLNEAGISVNSRFIYSVDPKTNLKDLMTYVFERKIKPTAIFCFCDSMAIDVMKFLKERKIRVPDDVAIMGCDNLDFTDLLEPPLTTVEISKYDMGMKAAKILLNKLNKEKDEFEHVVFEPKLIVRSST
ncbi:MAG TPA: LacI family DNA-binding transcriptional regulator [Dictyoglomaceae bacterium]|nr:LacI family DNA-binding transcriptional regulator [Dictyoglomaceae bacterium]HOL39314.1 LacI family DNA-binding transcriptional regulator [Dictyoglomaceae bacterium]HOP95033.1 LacI family DNA-binding transcriptional regulator [Dictyoglomaceae bacterium]HPP16004.1 LacI family DNA-binding transcriptional regulator [Dictyoglomaceae bacterium]HPU42975.1 LacI family DNA-binding transcriptional regulator [Dictyoglomaceae bacterium]